MYYQGCTTKAEGMARLDARLELRLDRHTFEQLEIRAAAAETSVAEVVRRAVARELAADDVSWRLDALRRAFALEIPVPVDPDQLCDELGQVFERPGVESTWREDPVD
jgi:hypothetical protein